MSEQVKTDIINRIRTWKAICVSNGVTYKEAIENANLNYDSVINAMGSTLKGNTGAISEERMRELEINTSLLILKKLL